MELEPYAGKLAMQLSGGMKRKLCVAIALIGDPKVVLLDEPSAGLDPVSRRNLWDVITKTMASRSVVLTTHSMEEAEALCTRIGIMVKGQLRILGTPQHLKDKFGSGYEIILQVSGLGSEPPPTQPPRALPPPKKPTHPHPPAHVNITRVHQACTSASSRHPTPCRSCTLPALPLPPAHPTAGGTDRDRQPRRAH